MGFSAIKKWAFGRDKISANYPKSSAQSVILETFFLGEFGRDKIKSHDDFRDKMKPHDDFRDKAHKSRCKLACKFMGHLASSY